METTSFSIFINWPRLSPWSWGQKMPGPGNELSDRGRGSKTQTSSGRGRGLKNLTSLAGPGLKKMAGVNRGQGPGGSILLVLYFLFANNYFVLYIAIIVQSSREYIYNMISWKTKHSSMLYLESKLIYFRYLLHFLLRIFKSTFEFYSTLDYQNKEIISLSIFSLKLNREQI